MKGDKPVSGVCVECRRGRMRHSHVRDDPRLHADVLGPNSIQHFWLEFWLKKPLEFWLEIPYTKKMFKKS